MTGQLPSTQERNIVIAKKWMFHFSAFIYCICSAAAANAASGIVKGQVEFIRTHDANQIPTFAPPKFWFTLKGVTTGSAGACQAWVTSTVLFVGNDRQELALVMAAQTSGQEIAVHFDDSILANGFCSAGYLTMGSPAPLQ